MTRCPGLCWRVCSGGAPCLEGSIRHPAASNFSNKTITGTGPVRQFQAMSFTNLPPVRDTDPQLSLGPGAQVRRPKRRVGHSATLRKSTMSGIPSGYTTGSSGGPAAAL